MALYIEDYAFIGDCNSAALVGRDGSIDWLCLPRFDSPACFAALLGTPEHGRWLVAPDGQGAPTLATRRWYREGTLVLESEFSTDQGRVSLVDFMPVGHEDHSLVRIVQGLSGQVVMRTDLVIRFDYGSIVPWVEHSQRGLQAIAGPDSLQLFTEVPLRGKEFHSVGTFEVREGQQVVFTLVWRPSHQRSHSAPRDPFTTLATTEDWWKRWSSPCSYQGPWTKEVRRSLITLKALTFAPTGGILAAATTSLPEQIGGVRNWDYRFCWLRDATHTLYALITGGYLEEARSFREWLIRAVAGKPSEAQIMYGLAGERRLTELTLPWLPGYEGSGPVRIGNDAYHQHQLDTYGELADTLHLARKAGLSPEEGTWRVQRAMMEFLESDWSRPDHGIWEVRGPARHFTHSKVMAWVAVDRSLKDAEALGLAGPLERWRELRDEIRAEVLQRGFNPAVNSFVQYYGADQPDASLLMLPLVGFLPAEDPRIRGTVALVQRRLMREGFLLRYEPDPQVDGLPPGEGVFLYCTFWLADNLALQGRHEEARELFERLLSLQNDVGLLSEEYDPEGKRLLGNFPQAFSHVGLVNTARNLARHGGPAEDRR